LYVRCQKNGEILYAGFRLPPHFTHGNSKIKYQNAK